MFFNGLVQSPQPNIPFNKKCLMLIDLIQQRSVKSCFLSPKILLTENRKDIEYRIKFLKDILQNNIPLQNTLYYQFIGDHDKGIIEDVETVSKKFIKLHDDIKKNGILEPIILGSYSKKKIKTRYVFHNKKTWINIDNENKLQIINGAHRLSVALFLGLDKVPVKIYTSLSFEIPNYTEYIKIKEPEYLKNLANNE
tara:strand:- start:2923 stop:3510 length:588 start_codon:yes stop_codon:yes gene_type:complete